MKIRILLLYLVVVGLAGCAGPTTSVPPESPPTPAALEALQKVRAQYAEGSYGEVIRRVATSDELAASSRAVRIEAYKLQAFSYCVSNYAQLCEDAFVRILRIDPAYTLAPNEAGHPTWGPVFRNAQRKAAANP
ncbi:TssQ family T6SS-associated lipoprotein [Bordetella genomosp. 13]|uniref:Lipoprotein n=1 Tax=Bordetella genomosp. 13 TaxID=463040 RepID=A0A1W6ZJ00_9BORD|nr:TssQ family T6SS-associated lipoprotein [Bordetella genomosp. 13]ARP97120.1 hypothetical protein CAL15_23730 [Bordetella genomosp. 13]